MIDLYHIESEQAVIGALLIDPNAHDRIDWLKESDFYREDHAAIYRQIIAMISANQPIDVITVAEALESSGVSSEYIGLAYLGDLAANTASSANITRYAQVVADKKRSRDLLFASSQIADLAGDESKPVVERIDEAQALIFSLAEEMSTDEEPEVISSVIPAVVDDIQKRFDNGGAITGLATGFVDLDHKTFGLNGGDLVIVAGRPSMGKTALALNIAENVALSGKSVLVFSMEMSKKQLTERSIASIGRVSMNAIRSGQMTEDDFDRMGVALSKLSSAKLIVDDKPALHVSQMRARARRAFRKHGLSLVVVDYIQLARGDGQSREQEVSSISRGLKAIAKELDVPVIALSQLSRKCEERPNKRPMLSDLRESGAIEQDADVILMMYRDEYYNPDTPDIGVAEIIIGKQRQGETGMVMATFCGEFSRFDNMNRDSMREVYARRDEVKPARKRGFA